MEVLEKAKELSKILSLKLKSVPGALRRSEGQSLVETAIVLPVLVIMFLGVLELGNALRSYLVLSNANREGARFAVRGGYMSEYNDAEYARVVSHTLESMAQQLNTEVGADTTVIISHYHIETRKPDDPDDDIIRIPPAADGSCYEDDPMLSGADCYDNYFYYHGPDPDRFPSKFDSRETALKLIADNNRFNESLINKDPGLLLSSNSVIIYEIYYEQPQLLGFFQFGTLIPERIPMYTHTVMRVSADSRTSGVTGEGGGSSASCNIYPIAIKLTTVNGKSTGDLIMDGWDGANNGNFGWLAWNPDESDQTYLKEELEDSSLAASDFTDANDDTDHSLNAGDDVGALTGVVNSSDVRTAIEDLAGRTIIIPVWDTSGGSGANSYYHVVKFVRVKVTEASLPGGGGNRISMTYVDEATDVCPGNGY